MKAMSISGQWLSPVMFVGIGDGVPDRRQSVLVVCTATLVIATIFITARLVSRVVIVRRVTWDDYCIVLGWVSSFGIYFGWTGSARCDAFLLCFEFYTDTRNTSDSCFFVDTAAMIYMQ